MWPGFGENTRVLKWIFERCTGNIGAIQTPIGHLPRVQDFDLSNLDIPVATMEKLLSCDKNGWIDDVESMREFMRMFGDRLPTEFSEEIDRIHKQLSEM